MRLEPTPLLPRSCLLLLSGLDFFGEVAKVEIIKELYSELVTNLLRTY